MVASRLRGLTALALLSPFIVACQPPGGHVAAVATGHFTAGHRFPVVMISWCGEEPPRQIDLLGEEQRRHLVATRAFEGDSIEVDLSAPGEDWRIVDDDGRAVYRMGPDSPQEEYLLGVGTVEAEPGEETEHDIAVLRFTTEALASEQGVYASVSREGEAEYTDPGAFPPAC
ncbi:hypothetical protein [Nocardiopsis lambiniae]|uniref:DUF2771 family protein n=1 Tax=Nocardiopsis lambiniae TaxID=3075539 RepID=A0ABU2M4W6_9ACTN|nr:hypothetical protein [Nocardiopsis sp. DSM 44743]MDT0327690.1 hypothetical protein [Nocardiopsis sp. DSM 44743]